MSLPLFKRTHILAGAIAIVLTPVFAGLPSAAQAKDLQNSTMKPNTMAGSMAKPAAGAQESGSSLVQQLKLTEQQKQKIAGIRRTRTLEINKVLTPDQKSKFEAGRKAGKNTSEIMASLGLKPDQKTKILAIAKKSAGDITAVLTPDQKKTLATYLKQRKIGAVE